MIYEISLKDDKKIIWIKSDNASSSLYFYNDDNESIYISNLIVKNKFRNNKLGTKLLELTENIGILLNAINAYLWVDKNSWLHDWYKRKGYSDFQKHERDGYVWMKKQLF